MENKNGAWVILLGLVLLVLIIGAVKSPSLGKFGPSKRSGIFFTAPPLNVGSSGSSGSKSQGTSGTSGTTIKKGPMQLIFPNGGEIWERGKQYNVRWNTDLAKTTSIVAVLFPTDVVVHDPYTTNPGAIAGVEMFTRPLLTKGFNDGSYSYQVPATLNPGTYQVLLWGGDRCTPSNTKTKCAFDLSDGLVTIQ